MRDLKMVGGDGLRMLVLSLTAAIITLGIPWAWHSFRVLSVARRTPADRGGPVMMVLGQKLTRDGKPPAGFKGRLDRATKLLANHPGSRIVILGGYTGRHGVSEAQAGREYLLGRGIADRVIHLEDRSLHTLENLRQAREILPVFGDHVPVLITCRFHLARTSEMARGLGLDHHLCAAEESFAYRPTKLLAVLLEGFFLHWYWVGRRWSEWTGNRSNLDRIT